jgi:hypothetical protein
MRKPKTLTELSDHPFVTGISDERGLGDGIWVYLINGYHSNLECGIIHEQTVKGCLNEFYSIKKIKSQ